MTFTEKFFAEIMREHLKQEGESPSIRPEETVMALRTLMEFTKSISLVCAKHFEKIEKQLNEQNEQHNTRAGRD